MWVKDDVYVYYILTFLNQVKMQDTIQTYDENSPDLQNYLRTFELNSTELWDRKPVHLIKDLRGLSHINEDQTEVEQSKNEGFKVNDDPDKLSEIKQKVQQHDDSLTILETTQRKRDEQQGCSQELMKYSKKIKSNSLDINQTQKKEDDLVPLENNSINFKGYSLNKSQPKHLEVYICFSCFLQNSKDCLWEDSYQYLSHLSGSHGVSPDFQMMLRNREKKFIGSHIFFKGKLTNILSNTRYQGEFKLYYQLKNQMFSQLYFCSCKVPSLQTKIIDMRWVSIFNSERNYITHCKKYAHKNKITSHQLKQSGSKIFLKKNPNFDIDLQMDKIKVSFNFMKIVLRSRINRLVMLRLLKKIPMNVLQIVSCNPGLVPPEIIEVPFPECQRCFQLFSHTRQLLIHRRKECTQPRYNYKYQCQKNDLKKLSLLRKFKSLKKQFSKILKLKNMLQLTQDESEILEAHLSIMEQNEICGSWKAFICGHCKAVFAHSKKPYFDYLLHIYRQHQTLHPLNSHYIRFVQKLPREMQEEDQEEDED